MNLEEKVGGGFRLAGAMDGGEMGGGEPGGGGELEGDTAMASSFPFSLYVALSLDVFGCEKWNPKPVFLGLKSCPTEYSVRRSSEDGIFHRTRNLLKKISPFFQQRSGQT